MQSVGDFEYGQGALIGHGAFALVFGGAHKKVRRVTNSSGGVVNFEGIRFDNDCCVFRFPHASV